MPIPQLPPIDTVVCPLAQGLQFSNIYGDWFGLAVLALLASVFMLLVFYIMAAILRNENALMFIKCEFFEIFSTFFILSTFALVTSSLCTINVGSFFPNSENSDLTMYSVTMKYYYMVENKFETWMHMQYVINFYIDQMASVTPYSKPLGVGLVATPMAGFASPIKSFLYNVFVVMAIAYVINEAQKYVFIFATYGFLKYFLPIGIFLRAFTPTRRIGGSLIAISLSFTLFLPLIMTFISESMMGKDKDGNPYGIVIGIDSVIKQGWNSAQFSQECKVPDENAPLGCAQWADVGGPVAMFFKGMAIPDDFNFITFISGGFFDIIGQWLKKLVGSIIGTVLFVPLTIIGMAVMLGFLFPLLIILILVQITRSFSKLIGEEIDISSLTRLI